MNPLLPRVVKVDGTITSTVLEPRTSSTATTDFARFLDDAAFGAYGNGDRHRIWQCVDVHWSRHKEEEEDS